MKNFFHMLKEDGKELIRPVKPLTRMDYLAVLIAAAAVTAGKIFCVERHRVILLSF